MLNVNTEIFQISFKISFVDNFKLMTSFVNVTRKTRKKDV